MTLTTHQGRQPQAGRTRAYRLAVIGCGARGETFARQLHAGYAGTELAGICDLDADRLRQFADYCGLKGVSQWTDPQAFLTNPAVDGVIVTTPEFTHADVAVLALGMNKHIYLEKPLAHTLQDCHRIVDAAERSKATAFLGFNMRAQPAYQHLHQVIRSGVLGRILHISGIEQMKVAHGAAYMRRWHRRASRSGGLLNTKCSHDLDMLQYLVGHEHKIVKVASFGGNSVFNAQPAPAPRCSLCPAEIHRDCRYRDQPGFVFPVRGNQSFTKHQDADVYGNDLCVYNTDKDIVDNQTMILEWDHGVRGNFNLQMFAHAGMRATEVWGEFGKASLRQDDHAPYVEVIDSRTGDRTVHHIHPRTGDHHGADPHMLPRFIDTIEGRSDARSGMLEGLAASLVALKADEARLSGAVVTIDGQDYRR
jgi:hypothetical protein